MMPETADDLAAPGPRWPASPFPGLRPFQISAAADESLIFYGRNRAKDDILARLNSSHLVFVVGPSGCGKSSLIKVGVVPALEAGLLTRAGANWRTAEMRPGDRPLRNLASALATFGTDGAGAGDGQGEGKGDLADRIYEILSADENGLWLVAEMLAPRDAPAPLLVVIDQFEEVFGSQVTAANEVRLLLELIVGCHAKAHPNLFLIVNMRTDFLEHCANSPRLADAINATLFVTPVLRDSELRSVISLPPEPYHGMVEETLIEAIVKGSPSGIGYNSDHLPLMQHALSWLWRRTIATAGLAGSPPRPDGEPPAQAITLTHEDYAAHGTLHGILNEHADELWRELSTREQEIAEVVFTRLCERDAENRYRRSPAAAAVLAKLAGCTPAELAKVVAVFADPSVSFLACRPLADGTGELVDLSHESLIRQWDKLRGWADGEAEKVRRFRELAASALHWQRHSRSAAFLKAGGELDVWQQWWRSQSPTAEWAERYKLDPANATPASVVLDLTRDYLARSGKQHRRGVTRVRFWRAAVATAAVLAIVAILSIERSNLKDLERGKYETAAARGRELLGREDPNLALLLALSGLRIEKEYIPNDVPALERLAYDALQTHRPKAILARRGLFPTALFSPDGRLLIMSNDNEFQVWNTETIRLVGRFAPAGVSVGRRLVWSADGKWIIGASNDGLLTTLIAPCSRAVLRPYFPICEDANDIVRPVGDAGSPSWPSALSPTGDRLLSGGWGTPPKIWNVEQDKFTLIASLARSPRPGRQDGQGPVGFAFAFNRRGDLFALGGSDGSVRVHRTANPTAEPVILRIPPRTKCAPSNRDDEASTEQELPLSIPVFGISFNPKNDDELVSTTPDGCVRLWSRKNRAIIKAFDLESGGFLNATFDPSGQRIALASEDRLVRVWEPGNPDLPAKFRGHGRAPWTVEFSVQTDLLASASNDSVRLWTLSPALHPSPLPAAPDLLGAAIVTSDSEVVRVRTARGRDITLNARRPGNDPVAAAVSMDGKRVLVAEKTRLRLYDLQDPGEPIAVFEIPGAEWKAAGFLGNPDRMAGETTDGKFYSWPYLKDREALIAFAEQTLPVVETGERTELSAPDQCRFGIVTTSPPC